MPTEPITGWPYDSSQDAPDGAGQMMRLVMAAADTSGTATPVLHATDAADRDAKYPSPQQGWLCSTTTDPLYVWVFRGTAWIELYSYSGWVTTGFTPGANWAIGSYMRACKLGAQIFVEGEATYTGSADLRGANYSDPSPGNLSPDQVLVTVPTLFRPGGTNNGGLTTVAACSGTSGPVQLFPSGNVQLTSITTNGKISTGDWCRFSFTGRAGA